MAWLAYLSMTLLMLVGLLLIFVILLQRGRGGGLVGALGGAGGQSALGAKAGDVFTKITVVLAVIWVVLAASNTFALRVTETRYTGGAQATPDEPAVKAAPSEKEESEQTDDAKATFETPAEKTSGAGPSLLPQGEAEGAAGEADSPPAANDQPKE